MAAADIAIRLYKVWTDRMGGGFGYLGVAYFARYIFHEHYVSSNLGFIASIFGNIIMLAVYGSLVEAIIGRFWTDHFCCFF